MPKIRVTFKECIQDSREYGSDDEYMVSRMSVDIAVDRARLPSADALPWALPPHLTSPR